MGAQETLAELQRQLDETNRRIRQCNEQYDRSLDGSESKRAALQEMGRLSARKTRIEEAQVKAWAELTGEVA